MLLSFTHTRAVIIGKICTEQDELCKKWSYPTLHRWNYTSRHLTGLIKWTKFRRPVWNFSHKFYHETYVDLRTGFKSERKFSLILFNKDMNGLHLSQSLHGKGKRWVQRIERVIWNGWEVYWHPMIKITGEISTTLVLCTVLTNKLSNCMEQRPSWAANIMLS
jgi:hypothetical protein